MRSYPARINDLSRAFRDQLHQKAFSNGVIDSVCVWLTTPVGEIRIMGSGMPAQIGLNPA
jgi:hypothetical protein